MPQQPRIEVSDADRPRSEPEPGAPGRWTPSRPGDIQSPEDMRRGGAFGRPGPDMGWAQRLVADRDIDIPEGENPTLVCALIAAVASARASEFGRAPTPGDVDFALLLLGLVPGQLPSDLLTRIGEGRRTWLREAARERVTGRGLLAALGPEVLQLSHAELKHRLIVESQTG